MKLQVIIKYKKIDHELESVTSVEHSKGFDFEAIQSATTGTDKEYFTFMQFIKRYLLQSLPDSHTPVTMVLSTDNTKTIHELYEGEKILRIDFKSIDDNSYREVLPTKGAMINKSINKLCETFGIKKF